MFCDLILLGRYVVVGVFQFVDDLGVSRVNVGWVDLVALVTRIVCCLFVEKGLVHALRLLQSCPFSGSVFFLCVHLVMLKVGHLGLCLEVHWRLSALVSSSGRHKD